MNAEQAQTYAETWIADWCRRDIESIVSHYAEDATFVSPIAAKRTGNSLVKGRAALTAYWSSARSIETFEFELERTVWDEEKSELVIIYTRNVNGHHDRACEIVRFNKEGFVSHGEAMYGAEIPS